MWDWILALWAGFQVILWTFLAVIISTAVALILSGLYEWFTGRERDWKKGGDFKDEQGRRVDFWIGFISICIWGYLMVEWVWK